MTRAELEALAGRVERASGPDRRLNAEIEIALDNFPERAYQQKNALRPKGMPELDRLEFVSGWFGAGSTASLDAAMKLVPEGWAANITCTCPQISGMANLFLMGKESVPKDRTYSEAATPALALTAAALRAHAKEENP